MNRWLVFDHELNKVVAFWWGNDCPESWNTQYPHFDSDGYEHYSIECEWIVIRY